MLFAVFTAFFTRIFAAKSGLCRLWAQCGLILGRARYIGADSPE